MDWSDDESDVEDPVAQKFGHAAVIEAHKIPDKAQQLVTEGYPVPLNAVLAASYVGSGRMLEIVLAANPQPNARLAAADNTFSDVEQEWKSSDVSPRFEVDKREWYALQFVADCYHTGTTQYGTKQSRFHAVTTLLQYKPNLFAVYKQPLQSLDLLQGPGEQDTEAVRVETTQSEDDIFCWPESKETDPMWMPERDPGCGHGLRSVLHSILEDGAYVRPFLEYPGLELDLEHQDPQGRTLLHAACRNSVGADCILDAVTRDILNLPWTGTWIASPESESSLFHTLRKRGANVNAEDGVGKNVLHHLLEARTKHTYWQRPPIIRDSLQYVLQHFPHLVNHADQFGTFPLHSAMQRLRELSGHSTIWPGYSPLESVVHDLLDHGAEPSVQDGRGNTALHWLVESGLAEQWEADAARRLCQYLCESGLDVNARNKTGRTALEILMDDDGQMDAKRWSAWGAISFREGIDPPRTRTIDAQVFEMFDKAGVRWTEQDTRGRTLLHIVAIHPTIKAHSRTPYLLAKGVDPNVKDRKGRTALDVAAEFGNHIVTQILSEHEGSGAV